MLTWSRNRRRRRLLRGPFPKTWLECIHKNVGYYSLLTDAEQAKLREDLRIFVSEKYWEGCGGLVLTDEIRVTIAAQAALLLLGMKHDCFHNVRSILVYPTGYLAPEISVGPDGVVSEGYDDRDGEAWHHGSVVLGWDAVIVDGRDFRDGRNVVLHEFAHQLDFINGVTEGTPFPGASEKNRRWQHVMDAELRRLIRETERGMPTLLDPYGTADPAEFFAVATECYFEKPLQMRRRHPLLYDVLCDFFGQDTAERFSGKRG